MALDVLEQGREPDRPSRAGRRSPGARVVVALASGALLVVAVATEREPPAPSPPASSQPLLRPLPRVLLDRATVLDGREAEGGVLSLRVGVEGFPGASLLNADVELPGSAVVLAPLPDRLSAEGSAVLELEVLPRCPEARAGLSRAAVRAVVRGRPGARVRQVRVRLDTAGVLSDVVRSRCGAVAGVPDVSTSLVRLAGPAAEPQGLRTRVDVAPAGPEPVTVVAVHPGPGLVATVRTPLPLTLAPRAPAAPLLVDLGSGGCGGAPDTPPYVLVLSTGQTVATSVEPALQPLLDGLRPYECAG